MKDEEILNQWRLDSDVTPRNYEWRDIYRSDLIDLIRRVREDERDKCAKVSEEIQFAAAFDAECGGSWKPAVIARDIAAAFRNRKEQP